MFAIITPDEPETIRHMAEDLETADEYVYWMRVIAPREPEPVIRFASPLEIAAWSLFTDDEQYERATRAQKASAQVILGVRLQA